MKARSHAGAVKNRAYGVRPASVEIKRDTMVTWKLVLAVIIIAILLMLAGMWFGYRSVRQQDDISPEARVFSLPAIAGHIRSNRDANVGVGLIPNPTPIS